MCSDLLRLTTVLSALQENMASYVDAGLLSLGFLAILVQKAGGVLHWGPPSVRTAVSATLQLRHPQADVSHVVLDGTSLAQECAMIVRRAGGAARWE